MFLISLNEWSFAIVIHIYFKKDYNKKVVVKKKNYPLVTLLNVATMHHLFCICRVDRIPQKNFLLIFLSFP